MSAEHTLNAIYDSIRHRALRDLAWALLHTPLFTNLPHSLYPEDSCIDDSSFGHALVDDNLFHWLKKIDDSPERLIAHLKDQRATRLGIYFEQLLSFYFAEYPRFELLSKNLQVNNEERTLGEYDFIVLDKDQQQHYHVEVAVKFYVGLPSLDFDIKKNIPLFNWHLWVGPNKKDTLGIKLNHLLKHQLRLSETKAGQQALDTIQLNNKQLKPKLLMTGRLYAPHTTHNDEPTVKAPQYSQHNLDPCQVWVSKKDGILLIKDKGSQQDYLILPRQLWMSPLTAADIQTYNLSILSSKQLLQKIEAITDDQPPLHFSLLKPMCSYDRENLPTLIEQQRLFLLP